MKNDVFKCEVLVTNGLHVFMLAKEVIVWDENANWASEFTSIEVCVCVCVGAF